MIELIQDLPEGVLGLRASGKVTSDDYEHVVIPAVERALTVTATIRLLYHLGPEFKGYEASAMWDDTRLGLTDLAEWERVAFVSGQDWLRASVRAMGLLVPCPVRVFANADLDQARAWICEPAPDGLQVDYLPESSVVRLSVTGALRAEDFQRAAARIDPLLEGQGELKGLMVRAERFPRWSNFAGLVAHLRFVREHHSRLRRVAFVSNQAVLTYFPAIARHFVSAELRHFPAGAEDQALAWLDAAD